MKHEFKSITPQGIGKQRMFISPKLFMDIFESIVDNLYDNFKGFSKFKVYIVCACDRSIFDLPNTSTTKKAFGIHEGDVFQRFISRGHVSCILDVHSKHILTSKIESRNVNEIKLAIEHLIHLNERFDLRNLLQFMSRLWIN